MFCSLETLYSPLAPDRVIHHPDISGSKHVMGLVFQPDTKVLRDSMRWVKVNLFVEPGHILSETGDVEHQRACVSSDASKVIKRWLHDCLSRPRNCREPSRRLPTRVIDVEPVAGSNHDIVRLIESNGYEGEYAALSHCWGAALINKTTKDSRALHARGVVTSSLCKTFREAIGVCRDLGIRYLWIDALCIVQDDKADWRREAELMADVYTNATVTVAATGSVDGTGGLLYPRESKETLPTLKWTRLGNTEHVYFQAHNPKVFKEEVSDAPLNQRGWVLQEMTLSARIVHFSRNQLIWECHRITRSETYAWSESQEGSWDSSRTCLRSPLPTQRMKNAWQGVVSEYTKCRLTYQSDKLAAIAGIAKA